MGIAQFERFFRSVASLDIDKSDLDRYREFISQNIYDLLLMGQATAKANDRDIIEPWDLPITKGLQECIHQFQKIDEEIDLRRLLEDIATHPPLDRAPATETEARLPGVAGGLSVALARTFKVVDPDLKNPQTRHWEQAFQIFDLLL
jgi:hypothetical protein